MRSRVPLFTRSQNLRFEIESVEARLRECEGEPLNSTQKSQLENCTCLLKRAKSALGPASFREFYVWQTLFHIEQNLLLNI